MVVVVSLCLRHWQIRMSEINTSQRMSFSILAVLIPVKIKNLNKLLDYSRATTVFIVSVCVLNTRGLMLFQL